MTRFLVSEGENQFCYMTFSYSILNAIGETYMWAHFERLSNGHLEEHDGCCKLKARGMSEVEKSEETRRDGKKHK